MYKEPLSVRKTKKIKKKNKNKPSHFTTGQTTIVLGDNDIFFKILNDMNKETECVINLLP